MFLEKEGFFIMNGYSFMTFQLNITNIQAGNIQSEDNFIKIEDVEYLLLDYLIFTNITITG